jgi:polysaccharide pyruvyl transferase WcaK-like protein
MFRRDDPRFGSAFRHLRIAHPDVLFRPSMFPEPVPASRIGRAFQNAFDATLLFRLIPSRRRYRARRHVRAAHHIVFLGGSNLFELRRPVLMSALRLRRLLEPGAIAKQLGVPYSFWGHTVGPFESQRGRSFVRSIFEGAEEVVVRESTSARLIRALSPKTRLIELPDLAFGLSRESFPRGERSTRLCVLIPRRQFLGTQFGSSDRFESEFAKLAQTILDTGMADEVIVVPQVVGPPSIEDDRLLCRRIVELSDRTEVTMRLGDNSPRALRELYGSAEFVVAVRLHGAILAMSVGTPAFGVEYFTAKTQGIFDDAGLSDSWCTLSEFSAERVIQWRNSAVWGDQLERTEALAKEARRRLRSLAEGPVSTTAE